MLTASLRLTALLGLLLVLSACAGRGPLLPDDSAVAELPRKVQLDVPFHAQDAYQCGPAALAMVFNHYGLPVHPDHIKDRVYLPERQGSLQMEMVAASRERDLLVYPLTTRLEALLTELAAGHPVLVMQNLGLSWLPQWHYAVVIGYDLETEHLIVHSGLNAAQRESFALFMRTWERAERWARVLVPAGQIPATAEPLRYLLAASELEQTGRLAAAAEAYESAQQQWPEQPGARLGLGNIAWTQARKGDAIEHFRMLVDDFPELTAGWNNLAVALENSGCPHSAKAVRQCETGHSVTLSVGVQHENAAQSRCRLPRVCGQSVDEP
ncbi:PA2778 family cysteine peptidase [Halopseudomonas salegens]|uniref:Tetratricopeptide repeat-containing protein n=1 Tax=Halopseudomonas salegens TaxID=1434072 RepID=A0A1H2FPB9_9GAMM|nr:PA2778 family cysteine peptidase [Halopseudomonas salegens]SDU09207.1 Tetratricopeptide repeat-containing protein [Halopseudomonas salegens]